MLSLSAHLVAGLALVAARASKGVTALVLLPIAYGADAPDPTASTEAMDILGRISAAAPPTIAEADVLAFASSFGMKLDGDALAGVMAAFNSGVQAAVCARN